MYQFSNFESGLRLGELGWGLEGVLIFGEVKFWCLEVVGEGGGIG